MEPTAKERFSLVHLNRFPSVGPGKAMQWRRRLGSAAAVVESHSELRDPRQIRKTEVEFEEALREGIQILGIHEAGYPESLRQIDSPPPVLYVQGRTELLQEDYARVAIVGSRTPTAYGKTQASQFTAALCRAGNVVVSGLARGIDEIAHRSALENGGDTIAVLGSGLLCVYPCDDPSFLARIREKGLLLSEFPLHASPRKHHFPWRNRTIAGLARSVLVVEAAERSGSLLTAHWAIDQGREVWAIPGRIDNPMSAGCHRLLKDGCHLALHPGDLLGQRLAQDERGENLAPNLPSWFTALEQGMKTTDELCEASGKPPETLLPELMEWEIAGLVVRGPGGLYRRAGSSL